MTIGRTLCALLVSISLGLWSCGGSGGGSSGAPLSSNPGGTAAPGASGEGTQGAIELAWDSVSGISGYRVYYGTRSGAYDHSVEVTAPAGGGAVSFRLTSLVKGQTYFLTVTARDSEGFESDFSNEVSGPAA